MMNRWSVAIGLIDIGGMDTSGLDSGTGQVLVLGVLLTRRLNPGTLRYLSARSVF